MRTTRSLGALAALVASIGLMAFSAAPASAAPLAGASQPSAVAAASSYIGCTPTAVVDNGTTKVASGSADCIVPLDTVVGVTVVLYVDGWNVGSTYTECTQFGLDQVCAGQPVSSAASGEGCARTMVTYRLPEPDGSQFEAVSVGNGCP